MLELAARVPAGSDGLVMLPYLLAERAPLWDPAVPGAYLGLRQAHTRAHLVRAAVEGVCLQLRVVLDQLDRLEPVRSVRVDRRRLPIAALAGGDGGDPRPAAARRRRRGGHGAGRGRAWASSPSAGRPALADAVALLSPSAETESPPTIAARDLVVTYDRLRASVPDLLASLAPVGELLARDAGLRAPGERSAGEPSR